MSLSNIINDNIIKVWALSPTIGLCLPGAKPTPRRIRQADGPGGLLSWIPMSLT